MAAGQIAPVTGIPGANVAGYNVSMNPVYSPTTASVGSSANPFIPAYPSGQAVPSFPGYGSPYGAPTGSSITSSGLPTGINVQSGLQSAGYPGSVAQSLSQFLSSGAGYNPQVASALIASLQPQIEQGRQNIIEQYGSEGLGSSSAAALGLSSYDAQTNLDVGQILSGLYEQSVNNYLGILSGAKQRGPGVLGDIAGLLGGLGGGQGISSLAGLASKVLGLGGSSAASAAPSVLGTALPSIGTSAGEAAAIGAAPAAAGLTAAGAGGALDALPLSTLGNLSSLAPAAEAAGTAGTAGGGLLGTLGSAAAAPYGAISGAVTGALGGGSLAGILGTIAGVAPYLAPLVLLPLLLHGANPNQVPAAQTEQPYEAAGDDIMSLVKSGKISAGQATGYLQSLIGMGRKAESAIQPQIGSVASKGSENLTNVIQQMIQKLSAPGFDPNQINRSSFVGSNDPGWYSGAGSEAQQLLSQLGVL